MTSFERVQTALNRGEPGRVPVLEFVVDQRVAQAIHPAGKDIGDLTEFLDLDGVGCGARFERRSISPDRYVDEWGATYRVSEEAVDHPIRGPIATLEDLRAYTPPDADAPDRMGDLPKYVRRFKGKRVVLFHHRAAFMWSAYLMGLDNLLMAMMIEPELVEAVMDVVLEMNIAIVRRAIQTGADMIVLGDDYASNTGPLMSPKLFGEFILPRLQKMVDAINPIEPVAGMDIAEVERRYVSSATLIAAIC